MRLVGWEKNSIRDLEYDLSALRGDSEARAPVEKLLALKRTHLETLEVLAAEQSPATVN
jgi:hypothetical protein